MADLEHKIQNQCMMRLSALDNSLFYRQNTGTAWQGSGKPRNFQRGAHLVYPNGKAVYLPSGGVVLLDARPISFGINGSGDCLGCWEGLPIQVEFKRDAKQKLRTDQERFAKAWRQAGGIYLRLDSLEQCEEEIEHLRASRLFV